jgi:DMSO reductase anchor subunit
VSARLDVEVKRNGGLLAYYLVLVSLQIFLLVVAVEGVLAHDAGPARAAAVLSIAVFASALVLRWFLRDD